MRLAVAVAVACLSIVSLSVASDVEASIKKQTDIPAQGLGPALEAFAKDRDFQVVYRSEVVGTLQTRGASGNLTPKEALTQLLRGTDLTFTFLDDKTVTIIPVPSTSSSDASGAAASSPSVQPPAPTNGDGKTQEGKRGFLDRFRLAQVDQGTPSSSSLVENKADQPSQRKPEQLEEVIVTAQKREERLQDVPVPVTVLNADELADTSQVNLRDYYLTVPGFSVTPGYSATQDLSIRGITTGGFSTPTVGVVIDDVAYGNSTATETNIVPDVDPGDLARIEVLRGPQGTLYGANSMGGLIKYVTIDPSTDGYSGRVEIGTSDVYNGAEPGFNLRGSINIPLSDTLAIRLSAFRRQDPGYIDNPVLNLKGVNEAEAYGSRFSLLWRPFENLSIKLSASYQDTKQNGVSEVDNSSVPGYVGPPLGELQQNYIAGVGGFDKTIQAFNANVNYKIGGIELTSITGYNINRLNDTLDYSYYLSQQTESLFGVKATPYADFAKGDDLSEEIRLSVPIGQRLEWLVGAIYRREDLDDDDWTYGSNPTTGQILGESVNFGYAINRYQEYAAFSDLTYHFTDRFDLQIGGRETHINEINYPVSVTGPLTDYFYGAPSPYVIPSLKSSSDTFTYLATPRFKLSDDLMVYLRLASGFRPGGANQVGLGITPQYNPDKTYNYELGVKGDFLDHTLSIDASIYYIDWKNIQFELQNSVGFPYTGNGGNAKSEGVELAATAKPLRGLTISGWVDYDDDVLTQAVTNSPDYLPDGARVPNTSRWSGNLSVNQEFPLGNGATGFAGAAARYVADRLGLFVPPGPRQEYPSYTRTDLRAGVKYETWTGTLYVNNAADVRGILNGGIGYLYPYAFVVVQPRTIGVSLSKSF